MLVLFGSYAGQNSGIPVAELTIEMFRSNTDSLFGFNGSEKQARTLPGWMQLERVESLTSFCLKVAEAYQVALKAADAVAS